MHSNKIKILIVGSSGFLGSTLAQDLNTNMITAHAANRSLVDLNYPLSTDFKHLLKTENYQYVVICAAVTDIEKCFQEPKQSQQINVTGTIELLKAIQSTGAIPVFFSSDYVFKPNEALLKEEDLRLPATLYGQQKLKVEQYIEDTFSEFLIFRTSKLMSKTAHMKNILFPIIQGLQESKPINCFVDQWLNPVFVEDIAQIAKNACLQKLTGHFHLGTRRIFNRVELGKFLATSLGYNPQLIQPIRMSDIRFSEPRPNHNTLNCHKIEDAMGFRFLEVEDAVEDIRKLANSY